MITGSTSKKNNKIIVLQKVLNDFKWKDLVDSTVNRRRDTCRMYTVP